MLSNNSGLRTDDSDALHKSLYIYQNKLTSLHVRLHWIKGQIESLMHYLNTSATNEYPEDVTSTHNHLRLYLTECEGLQHEYYKTEIKVYHLRFKLCCQKNHINKHSKIINVEDALDKKEETQVKETNHRFVCLNTIDTTNPFPRHIHDYLIKKGFPWYNGNDATLVSTFKSIMNKSKHKFKKGKKTWFELHRENDEIKAIKLTRSSKDVTDQTTIVTFFSTKPIETNKADFLATYWMFYNDTILRAKK